jgi:hypothetical protein
MESVGRVRALVTKDRDQTHHLSQNFPDIGVPQRRVSLSSRYRERRTRCPANRMLNNATRIVVIRRDQHPRDALEPINHRSCAWDDAPIIT